MKPVRPSTIHGCLIHLGLVEKFKTFCGSEPISKEELHKWCREHQIPAELIPKKVRNLRQKLGCPAPHGGSRTGDPRTPGMVRVYRGTFAKPH